MDDAYEYFHENSGNRAIIILFLDRWFATLWRQLNFAIHTAYSANMKRVPIKINIVDSNRKNYMINMRRE